MEEIFPVPWDLITAGTRAAERRVALTALGGKLGFSGTPNGAVGGSSGFGGR